jgi:hypothetical protein
MVPGRGVVLVLALIALVAGSDGAAAAAPNISPVAAAPGSIGIRLVHPPQSADNDPRTQIYVTDRVGPGATIHRTVEVSNTTANTTHILLYPAAAVIAGGIFLGAAGHTPNEVSGWTSVLPTSADVAPGGTVTAAVAIAVPSDAAPGERYGAVWAEASSTPTRAGGLRQVSRVGVRIYLSVGAGAAPAADFTIDSLTAERSSEGQPLVLATVRNTGGRALDMQGDIQLSSGPGGLRAGPFPVTLGTTLAIGGVEPVTIALDKQIPAGPWEAEVTLRSGLLVRSAHATITFPPVGAPPRVSGISRHRGSTQPATICGLILLAAATALVMRHVRRRRRLPTAIA